jgi:hypothetical protein
MAVGDRMVLYPAAPAYVPEAAEPFLQALMARGLLGAHWRDDRYLVGHRFMQEIVFTGCSPFLRVDPCDDDRFCHIQLSSLPDSRFLRSPEAGNPRCPQCRKAVVASRVSGRRFCPACELELELHECAWRAGRTVWSRFLISIWTLQKGDAQPTEALLDFLHDLSGVSWKTAFL